jgi:hypothetical protein
MALLNRNQIKAIVLESLETIADLPQNPEESNFESLTNLQKHIFLSALKRKLNASPYYMNDGSTTFVAYYDIHLKPDSTDDWSTVKDCINWIKKYQRVVYL